MNFNNFAAVFRRVPNAVAFVNGNENYPDIHGKVMFYQLRNGVIVRTEISGLPQNSTECKDAVYGFHIHGGEECTGNESDRFANVGGHYNPKDCPHPYHAGDMPPLFGVNGSAFSVFLTDRFIVPEIIGKTVIIHASADDFISQPSGNSGEKIACGVITPTRR